MSDNDSVPQQHNELSPELLGVTALNPYPGHDSSSRGVMMSSHIGQALVVKGADVRRQLTGVEREYAKYTFSLKFPCNARILKVVQKYPRTMGENKIRENPTTVVIYENLDHPMREVDILELPKYHWLHQAYGFHYQYRPVVEKIVPGAIIPAGTVVADSPNVTPEGDYKYGVNTQVVLMSYQPVIEDGVIASDAYLKRLTSTGYGTRTVSWGKDCFPLNLYGDENNYQPFPNVGDRIREDGLLFATRSYDEMLAPVHMTPKALREVDYVFDRTIYAEGGAKVVDVVVFKGNQPKSNLPSGMSAQTEMYYRKELDYYQNLLKEYRTMRRNKGDEFRISPAFHRLLVEAMAFCNEEVGKNKVHKTVNRNPLDEWCVQITYEYETVPTVGSKLTDLHGGKGVIVEIMKEEDMPVDAEGNRAEIIMDADSTIKRMNLGRLHEQYINASAQATARAVGRLLGKRSKREVEDAWDYLCGFYKTVSPKMYEALIASGGERRKLEHLEDVAEDGIYLWLPTDTPVGYADVVRALRVKYPAVNGPVTYRGASGRTVTTKSNIIIGSMYVVLLEKMGNTWAAVSSSKLQNFGIPAKLTNADRYSSPVRNQPVRILGESESRLFAAVVGGEVTSEILDQSNNPAAHNQILDNLLAADQPTNMKKVIDRRKLPRGHGRPLEFVRHVLECSGIRFAYGTDGETYNDKA